MNKLTTMSILKLLQMQIRYWIVFIGVVFCFHTQLQAQNNCQVSISQSATNLCVSNPIELIASGGFFSYIWSNGANTPNMWVSVPNIYTVTATDTNGCTATSSTIIPNMPLTIQNVAVSNVSAYGASDGVIMLSACGGTAPYLYAINGGTAQDFNLFSDLPAGTYTVQLIDANANITTASVVLTTTDTEPPIITCPADVTVYLPEGQTSVSVVLNPATATDNWGVVTITNNAPTMFSVGSTVVTYTATDAAGNTNNCTQVVTIVSQDCNITVPITTTPDNGSSNGTATAVPVGGTGSYTYIWSNGSTASTATGLSAGIYGVTVTDTNTNCIGTGSATVPCVITLLGYEDEDIKVPNGGNVTPNVLTTNNERLVIIETPCSSTNLGYKVVGIVSPSSFSTSEGIISSIGNTVTFNKSKGAKYKIYLIELTNLSFFELNNCITEDASGNVYSSLGQNITNKVKCRTGKITVAPKISLCTNSPLANQHSTSVGTLYVDGPDNAAYSLINTSTSDTTVLPIGEIPILAWDTYSLLVTETLTEYQYDTTLVLNPSVALNANAGNDISACANTTTIIGATTVANYTYQWVPTVGLNNPTIAQPTVSIGSTQTYSLMVTNENGCTATDQVTVIVNPTPAVIIGNIVNATCAGGSMKSIIVGATTTPYTRLWSNGSTTATISNLSLGTYTVTITDGNSCTASASASIVNVALGVPTNLSTTNITATNAKLHWSAVAGAATYTIQRRKVGTVTWTTVTATGTSKIITGLASCKNYQWRVRANCAGGVSSAFSAVATFTTIGCNAAGKINSDWDSKPETLWISPNPASNIVSISYNSQINEQVSLQIIDMMGKTQLQQTHNVIAGNNDIVLDISQLLSGYYVVELNNKITKLHKKLVLVR